MSTISGFTILRLFIIVFSLSVSRISRYVGVLTQVYLHATFDPLLLGNYAAVYFPNNATRLGGLFIKRYFAVVLLLLTAATTGRLQSGSLFIAILINQYGTSRNEVYTVRCPRVVYCSSGTPFADSSRSQTAWEAV